MATDEFKMISFVVLNNLCTLYDRRAVYKPAQDVSEQNRSLALVVIASDVQKCQQSKYNSTTDTAPEYCLITPGQNSTQLMIKNNNNNGHERHTTTANQPINKQLCKNVSSTFCRAEMYAGRVACCPW